MGLDWYSHHYGGTQSETCGTQITVAPSLPAKTAKPPDCLTASQPDPVSTITQLLDEVAFQAALESYELGGGQGLFFLVYFDRGTDGWLFSFDDAVVLALIQDDGRETDLSDVLTTRNPSYWFAGEDYSD